jgi:hypothetical protein
MCVGEILWRIKRVLWQANARMFRKWRELPLRTSGIAPTELVEMLDKVSFYGLSDIQPCDVPHKWVDNTIAVAEKLLQHRYDYLALGEVSLGHTINWNHEYKRGIDTPLLFGSWMDYHDSECYGDFKYFWELPRLQHLITLAKAYYLTNEERYGGEVAKQIAGFVEQSPYLLGVNWIMPMEAAIRLVSISWITVFLKEHLKNDAQTCELVEYIVKSHVDYVASNYAAYSSANNHLVAEATGVFIASTCFHQLDKMSSYRQKAYDILSREIIHQHYRDGVNKEQAVHYQIFAFQFLLLAGLLARANSVDFPKQYWEMLEKSANFIAAVADDNCSLPNIGDKDDGKAILLSETDCNAAQSILATAAVLFKRSDFKRKAKFFDETSFWLLGNKGKRGFDSLDAESPFGANTFEHGGYYFLTGNAKSKPRIVFDCGPLGFEPIAAHGHADSLSFVLSAYNRPYFIDPGTYTYIRNSPYRDYFRSTQAHNTVVIDGQSQSQIAGPFLWKQKAKSFAQEWVTNEDYDKVAGWHNGYQRLEDPVTHRRAVKLDKEQEVITIEDHLEMKGRHKIEQYFHLHPECHVEKVADNILQIENEGKRIELAIDSRLSCEVYAGSEHPICGWYSSSYDQKRPTHTVVCHGAFSGNQDLSTRIKLGHGSTSHAQR